MLKPGQKRTVRDDLVVGVVYDGQTFVHQMEKFLGEEVIIRQGAIGFCVTNDPDDWVFTESMFAPEVIKFHGNVYFGKPLKSLEDDAEDNAECEKEFTIYLNTMSPADMTEEQIRYCRQDFIAGWKRRGEREGEKCQP